MKVRKHIWIKGDIRGTFYRMAIMSQAKLLSITGWVRNVYDGLECIFEGDKDMVHEILDFCRQNHNGAFVKDIVSEEGRYRGEFKVFEIRER